MSIALSLGNNLTTGGVFKASAVNNTSCNNITTFASVASSSTLVLLSTQTASASSSISFTSGIDSTYDEYIFKFINCHPSNSGAVLALNFSTDGGSNYGVTKTTTVFVAYRNEADDNAHLVYDGGVDRAQDTAGQGLNPLGVTNDADGNTSGYMHLFQPSSTTYVKHFICRNMSLSDNASGECVDTFIAGYLNTTSAINAVRFLFNVGTIDDGIIKMYGVAKS